VKALADFVHDFISYKKYKDVILIGNSLGGHVTLVYVKKHQENIKAMVLTGFEPLQNNSMMAVTSGNIISSDRFINRYFQM